MPRLQRIGERRGVGFDLRFAQDRCGAPHQARDVEVRIGFDIGFPIVEAGTWTCPTAIVAFITNNRLNRSGISIGRVRPRFRPSPARPS